MHVACGARDEGRHDQLIFEEKINRPWYRDEEPSRRDSDVERSCGERAPGQQSHREHRGNIAAEPAREVKRGQHRGRPLRDSQNRVGKDK